MTLQTEDPVPLIIYWACIFAKYHTNPTLPVFLSASRGVETPDSSVWCSEISTFVEHIGGLSSHFKTSTPKTLSISRCALLLSPSRPSHRENRMINNN